MLKFKAQKNRSGINRSGEERFPYGLNTIDSIQIFESHLQTGNQSFFTLT